LEALVGEVALFHDVTVHQGKVEGMAVKATAKQVRQVRTDAAGSHQQHPLRRVLCRRRAVHEGLHPREYIKVGTRHSSGTKGWTALAKMR
jgi:hypothetical protein